MRNIVKEYIRYLKDNPDHYWFRAKLYGWGWTPARWQGWLVLGVFIVLFWFNISRAEENSYLANHTLFGIVPVTIALVLILIIICLKTGERPRWQWGIPKQYKDKI